MKVALKRGRAVATASFHVTNTGKRAGAEVAQLYLGFPPIAAGDEPPLQLKAFRKVTLTSPTVALQARDVIAICAHFLTSRFAVALFQ